MTRAALLAFVVVAAALPAAAPDDAGVTAPDGWTCNPNYYDSDDGCDCGCGIGDPDCADTTEASCGFDWCPDGQVADAADPTQCAVEEPAAPGWTCSNGYYGSGDGCDCGCGAADPDCASTEFDSCQYNGCETGNAPTSADPTQCAPGEWVPPGGGGDDDNGDNGEPPPVDEAPIDEPSTPDPEQPAPPTGAPQDTGGVDLNTAPPPRDVEEPNASGGCQATPGEPALAALAALVLTALRRRRR